MVAAVADEQRQALYTPTRIQRIVHLCPADRIVFGGQAGPGKTTTLYTDAIRKSMAQPGRRNVFIRRTYPELLKVMDDTKRWMPPGAARYSESNSRWIFEPRPHPLDPNRQLRSSIIRFSHLQREDDVYSHQTEEYDGIYIDEATHLTGDMIEYMFTRNRSSIPAGHAQTIMATNPGNIGHQYIKDGWVFPPDEDVEIIGRWRDDVLGPDGAMGSWVKAKAGTRGRPEPFVIWRPEPTDEMREAGEVQPSRCFIPAALVDNPHVDPAYKRQLMAIKDERLRKALLEGSWDIYEGQAFADYDEKIHVIGDLELMPWWRKWRSVDWGWTDPTAVYWHAYDPDEERVYTYRELYVTETPDKELCERINAMTPVGEHIDMTVADPSMFASGSNEYGMSRAEVWLKYGVSLTRAVNKREAKFAMVKQALAINPRTGKPNWQITRDCFNLRRTLPILSYALNGKQDIEQRNAQDHAYDAVSYGLLATPAHFGAPKEPLGPITYRIY